MPVDGLKCWFSIWNYHVVERCYQQKTRKYHKGSLRRLSCDSILTRISAGSQNGARDEYLFTDWVKLWWWTLRPVSHDRTSESISKTFFFQKAVKSIKAWKVAQTKYLPAKSTSRLLALISRLWASPTNSQRGLTFTQSNSRNFLGTMLSICWTCVRVPFKASQLYLVGPVRIDSYPFPQAPSNHRSISCNKVQWSSGPWTDFATMGRQTGNSVDFEPDFFWTLVFTPTNDMHTTGFIYFFCRTMARHALSGPLFPWCS